VITLAWGTRFEKLAASPDGAAKKFIVVSAGAAELPPEPAGGSAFTTTGTVLPSRTEDDRGFAVSAWLSSARAAAIAAGTPIPAIRIPSDSVIRLRDSIFSNATIRRAN
jgi:hypothetical protein